MYSRGLHGTADPRAEHVKGDRADQAPLEGRSWDAAIDTSGYDAEHGQVPARALISGTTCSSSSCNVYPDWPDRPVDEDSPTWQEGEGYGQGKAAAERAGDEAMGGRFVTVRAGLIVGPHDNVFRLPWWVSRILQGGRVPRPGGRRTRCRSSTRGTLRGSSSISRSSAQPVRSTGPGRSGRRPGASCSEPSAATRSSVWIPDERLVEAKVEEWVELPMWLPAAG